MAPTYPDADKSSFNALNAATVANRPSTRLSNSSEKSATDPALEAARIPKPPRDTHVSHPSTDASDERNRTAALRASTVSMAKKNQADDDDSHERMNYPTGNLREDAKNYLNLQSAAKRMASERLEKLDPDGVLAYRSHYGYQGDSRRSKLSVRRRRKSEGSEPTNDDEAQAGKIRKQMNRFNDKLASVDAQKQTQDRTNLMQAAEKSVQARMSKMDKKVFEETGKVTPAMMEEWEQKARAKAAAESQQRLDKHGLVDVGGGKYLTDAEVEAIAQQRMQPTLDEIGDTAEKQRARDEEIRADQEERKREALREKEQKRESKAVAKAQAKQEKDDEKERKAAEKQHQKALKRLEKSEAKTEKENRKNQKNRESLQSKETERSKTDSTNDESETKSDHEDADEDSEGGSKDKGKDPEAAKPSEGVAAQPTTSAEETAAKPTAEDPPGVPTTFGASAEAKEREKEKTSSRADQRAASPPSSPKKEPSKRDSRVRSFFGKLKRSSRGGHRSKSSEENTKSSDAQMTTATAANASQPRGSSAKDEDEDKTAAAKPAKSPSPSLSSDSLASRGSAKRDGGQEESSKGGRKSAQSQDEFEEARDRFDSEELKKPEPSFSRTSKEGSPQRSKFREEV